MADNIPKDARCAAVRVSGYWKGYPCCARPKHEKDGKYYCKNHLPLESYQHEYRDNAK